MTVTTTAQELSSIARWCLDKALCERHEGDSQACDWWERAWRASADVALEVLTPAEAISEIADVVKEADDAGRDSQAVKLRSVLRDHLEIFNG